MIFWEMVKFGSRGITLYFVEGNGFIEMKYSLAQQHCADNISHPNSSLRFDGLEPFHQSVIIRAAQYWLISP